MFSIKEIHQQTDWIVSLKTQDTNKYHVPSTNLHVVAIIDITIHTVCKIMTHFSVFNVLYSYVFQ